MAGPKVPLTFRIFKGDQLVREERLSLSVIKLGKVPSAHLKLDDETVSRMHAIIEVNGPGDVSIIDLGSTKGTFVNGQKVNKAKLQSGDTIVVGETRIELAIGTGEEEDAPTRVQVAPVPPQDVIASTPRPGTSPVAPPPAPMFSTKTPPQPVRTFTPVPAAAAPLAPPPPAPPSFQFQPPAPSSPSFAAAPPAPSFQAPPSFAPPVVRPPPGMATSGYGAPAAPFGGGMVAPAGFQAAMAESIDDVHGPRAVEVAAMLGDSVVAVKHCIDPKGGKVSPLTYGLFAIGTAFLLLSGISFYTSVDNAAYNKGKLDYWTGVLKKPVHAFRPTVLSKSYDAMAFGGLAIALFSLSYALVRARNEKRSPYYRIGTAPGVEFATEGAPDPSFPLIAPRGNDFVFNFGHGMEGEMVVDGQTTSLAELAAQGRARPSQVTPGAIEVAIPAKARIRVRAGKTTFLVSAVAQPRRQATPLFAGVEALVLLCFGGSLAAHMIFWGILQSVPVDDTSSNIDLAAIEDTTTRTSSNTQDDAPPPEKEDKPDDSTDSGGSGTAMTLDEGKMGKKDSTRESGQYKMAKTSDNPELARQQAVEAARTAGILGSSALTQGGAFASITGTGDVSSGFDDSNIYGGLSGNEAGEMNGGFGYGRSGFGAGGGGTGFGTIGTGRYGTIGHGSGTGSGYGVGNGRGGMRGRTAAVPTVSIGQPNANGDLDKAIIRRYIKRNIQKISYCYEKQLLAKPTLAGTVSTQFFITPNGTVQSSSGSGVDPEVASCVAGVISSIEFPKPKGGGGVQVNYPFTFRPAGQ